MGCMTHLLFNVYHGHCFAYILSCLMVNCDGWCICKYFSIIDFNTRTWVDFITFSFKCYGLFC